MMAGMTDKAMPSVAIKRILCRREWIGRYLATALSENWLLDGRTIGFRVENSISSNCSFSEMLRQLSG